MNSKNKNTIEFFELNNVKDGCHYACSLINWINTFFLLVIIIMLYQYLGK